MPFMPARLTEDLGTVLGWMPAEEPLRPLAATGGANGDPLRPLFLNADERGGVQDNGKPSLTIAEAAEQITRDGYTWNGQGVFNTPANVTFAFRSNAPGSMPDDTDGFSRFNEAQIAATLDALAAWSDVANITFTRVGTGTSGEAAYSDAATMLFSNYSSGADGAAAFAYYPTSTNHASLAGDVWVNSTFGYNSNPEFGRYGVLTLVHEIGHALGLGHPGDYDAGDDDADGISYANSAEYFEDSQQFTLMSYFTEGNTGANFGPYYPAAPMLDDIAAAQRLYGANMSTRTGDTTYGFNSNAGRQWFEASAGRPPVFAVWDAGGVDTFDFSGYSMSQVIDLRAGHFSSVGGYLGNVAIAAGAVIENVIGGSGADLIFANSAANVINGGAGLDTVSYVGSASGVTVRLFNGTGAGGFAQGDALTNIENVTGSKFNDSLIGDGGANVLEGGDGNDFLAGLGGADSLIGGVGADTADYGGSDAGVTVRLFNGTGSGGHAEGDQLTSIENVNGSAFADALIGGDGVNRLSGGAGNDFLAGLGGADVLTGGAGIDTADYSGSNAAVVVRLWNGTGQGGHATGDTLSEIENVNGSAFGDSLLGANGVSNRLDGRGGNDRLYGLGGDDILIGGDGDDFLDGGLGADTLTGGLGVDTADYSASDAKVTVRLWNGSGAGGHAQGDKLAGIENVNGSAFGDSLVGANGVNNRLDGGAGADRLFGLIGDDVLIGGLGDDVLDGGLGADTLDGGEGLDTADYSASGARVQVRLWNGTGTGGDAEGDTLVGIENVNGSAFNDSLVGANGLANRLDGGAGHDRLYGLSGDDVLLGGAGDDILDGGAGGDTLDGGLGTDTADYSTSDAKVTVRLWNNSGAGGHAEGDTYASIENVVGSAFNDSLVGANGVDNRLEGGAGNDRLYGLSGDDVLVGGAGDDILEGGAGADLFVFAGASGQDLVTDFDIGADRLQLDTSVFADFDDVLANTTDTAAAAIISKGGVTITLTGVSKDQLQAGHFEFVGAGAPPAAVPAGVMPAADAKSSELDGVVAAGPWPALKTEAPVWGDALLAPEPAPIAAPALEDLGLGFGRAAHPLMQQSEHDWVW